MDNNERKGRIMKRKNSLTLSMVPLLTILIVAFCAVNGYADWGGNPGLSSEYRPSGPGIVGTIAYYDDNSYQFDGECQGNSGTFVGPHNIDLGDTYEARDLVGTRIIVLGTDLVDPDTGDTCFPPENAGGIITLPCYPDGPNCSYYELVVVAAHNLNQDLNVGMSLDLVLMFVVPKGNQ
jgi:hypothetical protein